MPLSTTTVSTKGQVILPKPIRDARKWPPGTRLVVEDRPEGVLLRAEVARPFPPTTIEEVLALAAEARAQSTRPITYMTIEQMDEAIMAEVTARAERGRY